MRKNFNLFGGNCFNIEGDLILSNIKQVNSFYKTCLGCEMLYFFILKNYSTVKKLEEFVMGSFLSKKNWVKIKNLLLKGKEFSHLNTCGEIILRKDVDL